MTFIFRSSTPSSTHTLSDGHDHTSYTNKANLHSAMEYRQALQEAFTAADADAILDLLLEQHMVDVDARDASHGLQTYLMRLCHIRVSPEQRALILHRILDMNADVNLQVTALGLSRWNNIESHRRLYIYTKLSRFALDKMF